MYFQAFFLFPQLCTASVVVVSHLLPFHPGRYTQTVITVTFLSHPLHFINLISNQVCLRFKMRYGNWDVLLFPELSRVPIQEFKTQCFVTKAKDSPNLHSAAYHGPHPYYPDPARATSSLFSPPSSRVCLKTVGSGCRCTAGRSHVLVSRSSLTWSQKMSCSLKLASMWMVLLLREYSILDSFRGLS